MFMVKFYQLVLHQFANEQNNLIFKIEAKIF